MMAQISPHHPLIPAQAGIQSDIFLDSRLRGSEREFEVWRERENRLGLLMQIRTLAGMIADFERLEG